MLGLTSAPQVTDKQSFYRLRVNGIIPQLFVRIKKKQKQDTVRPAGLTPALLGKDQSSHMNKSAVLVLPLSMVAVVIFEIFFTKTCKLTNNILLLLDWTHTLNALHNIKHDQIRAVPWPSG